MNRGMLAAFVATFGVACLAMAPAPGPTGDSQETGGPTGAIKTNSAPKPATRPGPTPPKTPVKADPSVALGDRPAKDFPELDSVVDQVTRDLQRKIDADAKNIERKLMRQSQFSLGP